jgi:hypothetical protein
MRALMSRLDRPALVELGLGLLVHTPLAALAARVFFGRGSFPDLDLDAALDQNGRTLLSRQNMAFSAGKK